MELVPVLNLSKNVVVTHEAWPIVWGFDDGSGLIECGEPKYLVPKYTVVAQSGDGETEQARFTRSTLAHPV